MTNKQNTLFGLIGLLLGVVGGIAGTAFSMGADRQRVNDVLIRHTSNISDLVVEDKEHKEDNERELDRLTQIVADQMDRLQLSITNLTDSVSYIRTDVQVIKALIERIENDLKNKNDG